MVFGNTLGGSVTIAPKNDTTKNYTLSIPDISGSVALVDSPALTGTPTAPTATSGTNTTQLATTAFVTSSPALAGTPTAPTALAGTNTTQLATTAFVTSSPTFAGTPTAPTASTGTNTNQIATTAFVLANGVTKIAFHAQAGIATTQGSVVTYTNALFDTNNALNSSNGRFTAPVTGVYYFNYHQLANNQYAGECRTALYKNGSGYGGLRFITQKLGGSWEAIFAYGHIYMTAGDYVYVMLEQMGGGLHTDPNYGSFEGHLVN